MLFAAAPHAPEVPALEPLCALALEQVADVSCVDVVSGGVLRRAAAEAAGSPELTAWVASSPPAGQARDGDVGSAARRRPPAGRP